MRLQKLMYYCQAWHLVWNGDALFDERVEAWRYGPVVPSVFHAEKQQGLPAPHLELEPDAAAVVDAVVGAYGDRSGVWLSMLTHREAPWRDARRGLPADAASTREITTASMQTFYAAAASGQRFAFDDAYLRGLEFLVELPEDEVELLSDDTRLPSDDYLRFMETGDDDAVPG